VEGSLLRTEEEIYLLFDEWARNNELIRAAVLTSSRVKPGVIIDFLSDYDIELYVSDIAPFQRDDAWLSVFGEIMVRWPLRPRPTLEEGWITRLVLFKDYLRIDFQITDQVYIQPDAYQDGYRVLIDKNNLTAELNPPSFACYNIKKPTQDEYDDRINAFWWDATYVPKYLWRDELPFAAFMLGCGIRDKYLRRMIEWYVGMENNWAVDTGLHGKWFKRYLSPELWADYESTFAGAGIEEHWTAFFNAVSLFRKLAKAVGSGLGYKYPEQMDREISEYHKRIRNTQ
jgi:aminoglycoside 6-adenylyltransferase